MRYGCFGCRHGNGLDSGYPISRLYNAGSFLLALLKLKYIALVLFILGYHSKLQAGTTNSRVAHFAHIGGALFGMLYVYLLRKGTDLTEPFQSSVLGKVNLLEEEDMPDPHSRWYINLNQNQKNQRQITA